MTSYPNPGARPESIGGGADDLGTSATTETGAGYTEVSGTVGTQQPYTPSAPTYGSTGSGASGADTSTSPDLGSSSTGSKTDTAKSEAADVKDTALSAGSNVAGTAKEEAGNVVHEVSSQARGLLDQLRSDVREQGSGQKDKIASTLHSLSSELGSMASKSEESGPVTDLAHQASRRGGEIAHWLENHEPADVLDEVRRYARRRPFAFLAICAGAGIVVGRLTRGAVAANTSLDSPSSSGGTPALTTGTDRPDSYVPAPGPYAASVSAGGTTDPYGSYTPEATAPAQNWPPSPGYAQNDPTTTAVPGSTGILDREGYGGATTSPLTDQPLSGQSLPEREPGEYRS